MRLHHYPGLFGDPRGRGLNLAIGLSIAAHLALLVTVSRIHTRPMERQFFTPVQMVDLVERPAKPTGTPASPAAPIAAETKVQTPVKPPAPKPAPTPPKPTPRPDAVKRIVEKAREAPKPKPPPEARSETQISDRIARMREKYGASARSAPGPDTQKDRRPPADVRHTIESLRQRVGASSGEKTTGGRPAGMGRSGANKLQQVRFRTYLTQMANHMQRSWSVPPSLLGRNLSTIIAITLDKDGSVLNVVVEQSSGSKAFDDTAVRSIYRASPFPPPPETILKEGIGFRLNEKGGITGGD